MLKVDRKSKTISRLDPKSLSDVEVLERQDLQQWILNSPDDFFAEIGESLLLIGQEVKPSGVVDDRIDLLAVDQQGRIVVLELKRGAHKLQLLQALSYAAMVSVWDAERITVERAKLEGISDDDAAEEIERFVDDPADLNETQQILLFAQDFDYSVLVTAEWLVDNYELDIRCYRLALATDKSEEFLSCTRIYPPTEISDHAVRRGRRRRSGTTTWADWQEALNAIDNAAVADHFRDEIERGCSNSLHKRALHYAINGKRRYNVEARRKAAYVWQIGRFMNDQEFWLEQLDSSAEIRPVAQGHVLRFYLKTSSHFAQFNKAINTSLNEVDFISGDELTDIEGAR